MGWIGYFCASPYSVVTTNANACLNSSPPSARQWNGSALLQIMACRLFGAKPLPEPMLAHCQLDPWEQNSVKFESECYHFHSRKYTWKCLLPEWRSFCSGGRWVNNLVYYLLIKPLFWLTLKMPMDQNLFSTLFCRMIQISAVDLFPDNQIYGVNKGPTWILPAPDGPHVGPMNLVIWVVLVTCKGRCVRVLLRRITTDLGAQDCSIGVPIYRDRYPFNTLRPRQNGRRFADDTFKRIFLNENVRISIKI